MRVNRKIQRYAAGNWGKPNKTEQKNTKIPVFPEETKHKPKKKKKNPKPFWVCPFCGEELPKVHNLGFKLRFWRLGIAKKCHKCGAREVHGCPCCKDKTWFREGKYKHPQRYNFCGYQN